MVPLRDMATHELLPGIEAGDIGPKFGYNSKNNGFLRFNQVRIPRENLLSRYVELTKDGQFKKKGDLRILYSIMMATRLTLIQYASRIMQQGITIAGRYACCRRQFNESGPGTPERRLIDYQTHQFKLIPLLASTYAIRFSAGECIRANMAL